MQPKSTFLTFTSFCFFLSSFIFHLFSVSHQIHRNVIGPDNAVPIDTNDCSTNRINCTNNACGVETLATPGSSLTTIIIVCYTHHVIEILNALTMLLLWLSLVLSTTITPTATATATTIAQCNTCRVSTHTRRFEPLHRTPTLHGIETMTMMIVVAMTAVLLPLSMRMQSMTSLSTTMTQRVTTMTKAKSIWCVRATSRHLHQSIAVLRHINVRQNKPNTVTTQEYRR
jgi:hypothetical protein